MNPMMLNVPRAALRGELDTKRAVHERLGYYMNLKIRVKKQMPSKFPPVMVEAAVAQCNEMIAFYVDLEAAY